MRLFQLLRLAAQAEALRWKRTGRGYAIQAGLGAAAAIFGLMLLLMLHVAALIWLARGRDPAIAALIVAGVDLVLAAILGWLAARHAEDPVAVEAQRVRDDALRQVSDTTARAAMVMPLLRSQSAKKGLVGAALTAAVVGLLARR
jgi:Putative Actinobacterial Holin-X, holin superfamily III